jgi:hypothetical protein
MEWQPVSWQPESRMFSCHSVSIDLVGGSRLGVRYAVRKGSCCLNHDLEWEYEPLPSSRDDDFLARCRFGDLGEAKTAAEKAMAAE